MKYNTYIQQIRREVDGSYSKGSVVDLLDKFKIACQSFPFKFLPKRKDLPSRDWAGSDGLDVYIPSVIPMKEYEIDVKFLYLGDKNTIHADLKGFINFLYGRMKGDDDDSLMSGLLCVYDEHVGMGRKDVVVSEVENTLYHLVPDSDDDAIATFTVKFMVYDPVTEVTPTTDGYKVTDLNFSQE